MDLGFLSFSFPFSPYFSFVLMMRPAKTYFGLCLYFQVFRLCQLCPSKLTQPGRTKVSYIALLLLI